MDTVGLRIEGPAAAESAAALADLIGETLGERPAPKPTPAGSGASVTRGDPWAVAAVLLAVPSALLATLDLAARLGLAERLGRLIDLARRGREERGTVVTLALERSGGLPPLDRCEPDQVLEAIERARRQGPPGL